MHERTFWGKDRSNRCKTQGTNHVPCTLHRTSTLQRLSPIPHTAEAKDQQPEQGLYPWCTLLTSTSPHKKNQKKTEIRGRRCKSQRHARQCHARDCRDGEFQLVEHSP